VVLAAVSGCAAHRYDLDPQGLSCDQANRYTYRTVSLMGFQLRRFEPAAVGRDGMLEAVRTRDDEEQVVRVRVTCDDASAIVLARSDRWWGGSDLERAFAMAFIAVTQHGDQSDADDGGLRIRMEPIPGPAARLDFDLDLAAAGVLPVRVTIDNQTERAYRSEAVSFVLIDAAGHRTLPLPSDDVAAAVSSRSEAGVAAGVLAQLRARAFDAALIEGGQRVSGYLFFPLGSYVKGRAVVEEVESGETEGVVVEFQ
jgi:hypothetical protein